VGFKGLLPKEGGHAREQLGFDLGGQGCGCGGGCGGGAGVVGLGLAGGGGGGGGGQEQGLVCVVRRRVRDLDQSRRIPKKARRDPSQTQSNLLPRSRLLHCFTDRRTFAMRAMRRAEAAPAIKPRAAAREEEEAEEADGCMDGDGLGCA
jgi:hypothetical protein